MFDVVVSHRLAACSRCYRAELPGGKTEGNLYRVHEFTKVEMFAVTVDDEKVSQAMHDEIVRLQTLMFEELGLHFRILDMPTEELGLSAHRKYDIEAWLPAKGFFGEVSAAATACRLFNAVFLCRSVVHRTALIFNLVVCT